MRIRAMRVLEQLVVQRDLMHATPHAADSVMHFDRTAQQRGFDSQAVKCRGYVWPYRFPTDLSLETLTPTTGSGLSLKDTSSKIWSCNCCSTGKCSKTRCPTRPISFVINRPNNCDTVRVHVTHAGLGWISGPGVHVMFTSHLENPAHGSVCDPKASSICRPVCPCVGIADPTQYPSTTNAKRLISIVCH